MEDVFIGHETGHILYVMLPLIRQIVSHHTIIGKGVAEIIRTRCIDNADTYG